jgi:hypothetical protein
MPKGTGYLNPLIFKYFLKIGISGKDKEMTFFVPNSNYLMTLITFVDPKQFRLWIIPT